MSQEQLTVYNEQLEPIGEELRSRCHELGLLHMVVHCWILSRRPDGDFLWFQRRAFTKKDFPGLFDLAVGGHIDPGESPLQAMKREMGEELGVFPPAEQLRYLGSIREEFRMPGFFDREIAQIYLWEEPYPAFQPGEEVESMAAVRVSDYQNWEAGNCTAVPALNPEGESFVISEEQWVCHSSEFQQVLLPLLQTLPKKE